LLLPGPGIFSEPLSAARIYIASTFQPRFVAPMQQRSILEPQPKLSASTTICISPTLSSLLTLVCGNCAVAVDVITQWTSQNTQFALTTSTSSIASARRSDGRRKISRAKNFPRTSNTFSTDSTASKREREQRAEILPTSHPTERLAHVVACTPVECLQAIR
jgi:hypothetical protein